MDKRYLGLGLAAVLVLPGAANATLIDRGGGLIYDSTQDITWLQVASFSATNSADPACIGAGANTSGTMNWVSANSWADMLLFGGFDDWRLPTTTQPDPSCSDQSPIAGFPDRSGGVNCIGSEMGHLFKVCRYLVVDFGTSQSPNSTRLRDSHLAAAALRPYRCATPSQARCGLRSTPAMA